MNQRDRLIELIEDYTENVTARELHSQHFDKKFADHLLANGVIVSPCKVGDKVYQYDNGGRIYQSTVKNVIYDTENISFDETAVGKTVFLTREEAEKVLEDRKNEKA